MHERHVLVVGATGSQEFLLPIRWLHENSNLKVEDSYERALHWLRSAGATKCDTIVFAQRRRREIPTGVIEEFHRAAPLARLIALLGTWCEGDLRSFAAPNGLIRVYWHQFCVQAEREWSRSAGSPSSWGMPRTAADNETRLQEKFTPPKQHRGVAVIYAASLTAYEGLAEACQSDGWSSVWLAPRQSVHVHQVGALIWDVPSRTTDELESWREWQRRLEPTVSVVIAGFPRHENVQELTAAGATSVLGKPLLISDLLTVLRQANAGASEPSQPRRAG